MSAAAVVTQVGSVEADLDGLYDHHIAAMIDDDEDADAIIARHEQQQHAQTSSNFTSPVKQGASAGTHGTDRIEGATPTDPLSQLVASTTGLALNPTDLADTPSRDLAMDPNSGWGSRVSGMAGAGGTPVANRTPTPGLFPFGQLSPQSVGRPGGAGASLTTPLRGAPTSTATPLGASRALDVAAMLSNPAAYGLPALVNSPVAMEQVLAEQRRQQLALLQLAELGFLGGGFDPNCLTNGAGMMDPYNNGGGNRRSPQFFDPYATSNTAAVDLIRGRVYEIAKDQHGCRYLQRLLDAASYEGHEASQIILVEITPHVAELMTDQYANFLVQKLFDIMPHDIRYQVAQIAAPQITQIALTPHGTFSVQKLIETIATREEMEVIRAALARDVVRLVKDVHGNHVVQKVLQRFDHPDKQFIYDAMCQDCAGIATNKQGCCVLQRCLEFASAPQRLQLVASIIGCALMLIQDPFGNYVLQYVLEGNDAAVNDGLAALFLPHLATLCVNKFSSNVVEKMLRSATQTVRDAYVAQLKDPNILLRLLQDDFGNYVIQTALSVASPSVAEGLVHAIRPHWPTVRNAPYAKKLEAKMEMVLKKRGGGYRGGHAGGFSPGHRGSPEPDGPASPSSASQAPHVSSPPHGMGAGYRIRGGGRRDV